MAAATAPGRTASPADTRRREQADAWPGEGATAPLDVREGWRELGRRLAGRRDVAGVTQVDLAYRTGYSRSLIANIETGRRQAPRVFWVQVDRELGADGVLVTAFDQVAALARGSDQRIARPRGRETWQRIGGHEPGSRPHSGVGVAPQEQECGCGLTVAGWGGRQVRALRVAMRLSVRAFAQFLNVAVVTVSAWESRRPPEQMCLSIQDVLDQALKLADAGARARFRQLLDEPDDEKPGSGETSPCDACADSILREAGNQ